MVHISCRDMTIELMQRRILVVDITFELSIRNSFEEIYISLDLRLSW